MTFVCRVNVWILNSKLKYIAEVSLYSMHILWIYSQQFMYLNCGPFEVWMTENLFPVHTEKERENIQTALVFHWSMNPRRGLSYSILTSFTFDLATLNTRIVDWYLWLIIWVYVKWVKGAWDTTYVWCVHHLSGHRKFWQMNYANVELAARF